MHQSHNTHSTKSNVSCKHSHWLHCFWQLKPLWQIAVEPVRVLSNLGFLGNVRDLVGAGNAFGCSVGIVDVDVGVCGGGSGRAEADVVVMGWPLWGWVRLLGGTG